MLFAHLKRILTLNRLRLRGPKGANDEFLLVATAQNLTWLAKLIGAHDPDLANKPLTRIVAAPKNGFFNETRLASGSRGDRFSRTVSANVFQ
jgi:hypothetical protein